MPSEMVFLITFQLLSQFETVVTQNLRRPYGKIYSKDNIECQETDQSKRVFSSKSFTTYVRRAVLLSGIFNQMKKVTPKESETQIMASSI